MSTNKQFLIALALLSGVVNTRAVTVFSDDFTAGSTLNSATPAAPTSTSTAYAILSTKSTGSSSIAANDLKVAMSGTTTGIIEAQARFATSPLTRATTGDYVELTMTFNNTLNLLTSGNNSYLGIGLYDSGGAGPVAGGALAASGLNATAGSPYATGYAAGWEGYATRMVAGTGTSRIMTRPVQDGTGTASRNQDVIHPGESSGYNNPSGTQIGSTATFGSWLTQGNTYTYALRLTLNGSGFLDIQETLYDGVGTGGTTVFSLTGTTTGATTPTLQFDSLGFGWKHSVSVSSASTMDVSRIEVTSQIAAIPEPTSASLLLGGAGMWLMWRRHRNR